MMRNPMGPLPKATRAQDNSLRLSRPPARVSPSRLPQKLYPHRPYVIMAKVRTSPSLLPGETMRILKRTLTFIFGLGVGVALAVFISRNGQQVIVNYYIDSTQEWPLWAIAMAAFALGLVTPLILYLLSAFDRLLDRHRLRQRIRELELELVSLRNLPLHEASLDLTQPFDLLPLANEAKEGHVEVLPSGSALKESDLYPAVYDNNKR